MNGLEHHDAAQELLERARAEAAVNGWGDPSGGLANQLAAAQVHASLGVTAPIFAPPAADEDAEFLPPGLSAIVRERARQKYGLGYTAEHDKEHQVLDFVGAAVLLLDGQPAYLPAFSCEPASNGGLIHRDDLVRAGALIAAAIDRLDQVATDD